LDTRKKFGNVYIILAALLWSTAGVCVKYIPWSAYSIACFRSICGAITFCIVMRKPHITFNRWNIAGALAMFLTGVLYMSAIKLTTAANAIVLQYTAPILIILYNTIFEHRKPSRLDLIITACVIAGCVLAFSDQLEGGGMLGNLLALASGVTFAGLMIINRKPQTDAMESQLLGNLLSVLILMPFLLTDRAVVFDWRIIGAALFLGFQLLRGDLPWVAFALAIIVVFVLVGMVRVLRRSNDTVSIALAVVVGLAVTCGPLLLRLIT